MSWLGRLLGSRRFSRTAAVIAAAGLVAFWLLAVAGRRRPWPPPSPAAWAWIPVLGALAALGGLAWRHRRGPPDDLPSSTAWKVAAVVGALMLLPTVPAAVSSAASATGTVQIDYEATASPSTEGRSYHVLLPTASRIVDLSIVDGSGDVEFVETDHGRAVSIRSDETVTVAASLERTIPARDFDRYHPTMTTVADENATWEDDKSYRVFLDSADEVSIRVRIDIGWKCGVYENRLDTVLQPPSDGSGWTTVDGSLSHPHGDLCGIEGLMTPLAFFAFPVVVATPYFGAGVAVAAVIDRLLV